VTCRPGDQFAHEPRLSLNEPPLSFAKHPALGSHENRRRRSRLRRPPPLTAICTIRGTVLCLDIDQNKIDAIEAGRGFIKHISGDAIKEQTSTGRFPAARISPA